MLVVPGSQQVKRASRGRGTRRRSFRDAGAEWRESGLLDVHRHERRHACAPASTSSAPATAISKAARAGRAHVAREPADRRRRRGRGRDHRSARVPRANAWNRSALITLAHRRAAAHRHRHRPDHPRALPDDDDEGASASTLFADWRYDADGAPKPDFALNRPESRRLRDPGRGRQLRLRLLARARALGAARLRHPRGDQHLDRRHLPQQRAEERPAAGRGRRDDPRAGCWRIPASKSRSTSKARRSTLPDGTARRVSDRPVRAPLPAERHRRAGLPAAARTTRSRVYEQTHAANRAWTSSNDRRPPRRRHRSRGHARRRARAAGDRRRASATTSSSTSALIGGAAIDAEADRSADADARPRAAQPTPCCSAPSAARSGPTPNAKVRPEQGLLALRKGLGPVRQPAAGHDCTRRSSTSRRSSPRSPAGSDIVVVRELTGGIYFGEKRRTADSASDLCTYTRR